MPRSLGRPGGGARSAERGVTIRAVGLRQFRRDLKRMGGNMADLKSAAAAAGEIVAAEARRRAPKRSGRLAASVRTAKAAGGVAVRVGGARAPYAGPIHWGWPARKIQSQPFVTDAAHATEPLWLAVYTEALNRAVDRVAGRTY